MIPYMFTRRPAPPVSVDLLIGTPVRVELSPGKYIVNCIPAVGAWRAIYFRVCRPSNGFAWTTELPAYQGECIHAYTPRVVDVAEGEVIEAITAFGTCQLNIVPVEVSTPDYARGLR